LLVLSFAAPVYASDFWDEVRTPGLRAYRALTRESRSALRSGQYEQALTAADEAIKRLENVAQAHVLRGRALYMLKRSAEAVTSFERALSIDETALDNQRTGIDATDAAVQAADYALAANILKRVLGRMRDGPRRRRLYALLGDLLQSLGPEYLNQSIMAYREAMRGTHAEEQRTRLGLALALRRSNEMQEMRDLIDEIGVGQSIQQIVDGLSLPRSECQARLAVALEARGDMDAARRVWSNAATPGPWQQHIQGILEGRFPAQREDE